MVLAHETLLFSLRSACACIPDQNLGEVAAKILDGYALSMESYNIVSTIVGSLESRQTLLELSSKLGLTNDPYLLAAQRTDDQRIAMLLVSIFTSKYEEDAVLRLRGDCAQYFLDVVQETFDKGLLRDEHSRMARRIVRKLSEACDKLPNSLFITGVSGREEYASFGGGYGDIFQALYNQKPVALKRMRYFIHESDLRLINLKFCREALVWKDLRHPHILPFLGIDRDSFPPTLCMVSPWMKHGTVMHYLKDHGIANIDQLLYEIAQGLQYLHSNNIVHGDLRGTNILINEKESACLTDFGLSNFSDATSSMTTNRGGSSYWMAPELLDPDRFGIKFARTPASDVYAFGCVCFELYTGQPPFANLIEPAALMKILNGARPDRPVGSPVVSDILWRHVSEYWAHHPKIRPVTQLVVQNMKSLCPKTSASPTVSLPPSLSLPLARSAAPTPVQTPGILPPEFSPQSFVENVSHDANPQPVGDQYEILFDYQAPTDDPTETPISFHEGEIVYVLKERGVWAEVIKANGSIGIVPSHCIKNPLTPSDDSKSDKDPDDRGEIDTGEGGAPDIQWNWKKLLRFGRKKTRNTLVLGPRQLLDPSADEENELTRKIRFLVATDLDDWTLLLDVCDHASATETNAKEAVSALRSDFKFGEPAAQLAAARLWAMLIRNASDTFISQSTSRKFLDTLEDLLTSSRTSLLVRERVMNVLAAAVYTCVHGFKKDAGFRAVWRRVKPQDKPEQGIPFDPDDAMFHPPLTSEDMRRLYDECRMGVDDANSLSRTLLTATPEQLKAKALIVEELRENCIASQNLISSQISRASASAERRRAAKNQAMRTTSGSRSLPYASTRQEKLLAELLASNEQLLEALKLYDDLQRVALEAKVDHMNSDGLVWAEEEFVTHARVARLEPAAAYWPSPVHSQVQKPFAPHGPRLRSNYGPPLR